MPAPLMSREELVRRLFGVFRTYGFEGASLARISEATGLGRASLYHYFPDGKDGMLREVLDLAKTWIRRDVRAPLLESSKSAQSRLRSAMRNIVAGYDGGASSCLVNVFGLGDSSAIAPKELADTAAEYVDAFSRFLMGEGLAAAKARDVALDAVVQIEGALVVARALRDKTVFSKRMDRLEKALLEHLR